MLIACLGLLIINAIGMWTVLYLDHAKIDELRAREVQLTGNKPGDPEDKAAEAGTYIDKKVENLELEQKKINSRLEEIETSVEELESTTSRPVNSSSSKSAQKEYTIYLGEGSTISREWTTVQATTVALDTSKYQHISNVLFEAGLSTKGGEAYAQLIDAETGGVIAGEVMNNSPDTVWKSSKANLSSGNQMYVVQIRSSSGELVSLGGARLRITAD